MTPLERSVDYAEYLVEMGRQNPAALAASIASQTCKDKSIHQKLLDLYIEESSKQQEGQALQCNTHLLKKLVRREKLSCLILNLYAGNEGYSLMLRSKTGVEMETCKLPYEVTELLEYIDDSELPPFLVDVLEKAQVNVFNSGCVIVEIRDFRRSTNGTFDMQYVLLKPNPQTLLCDINNLTNDGHVWTQEDLYLLESRLLLATEEPLCLDPSPAVLLVANKQQYDRRKMNTPLLKRSVRKFSQSAVNRKRKIAQSPAPRELQLHDFIANRREKKNTSLGSKFSRTNVDFWKQKQVPLSTPEIIDVEKFAKVVEKQEKSFMEENTLSLLEEHVLERDGMQDKKLLAKLTILHRPSDDAHIGELYLDHDYKEDKSVGATCRFFLGNKDSVRKYLDQFREIFTEEGRRAVKITTHRPGQRTIVTCTQTLPTDLPTATVGANMGGNKTVTSTPQQEMAPGLGQGGLGPLKRQMPIQLALNVQPPGLTATPPPGTSITPQGTPTQSPAQIQLSLPTSVNQSPVGLSPRLPHMANQTQSASQRLKQLGFQTSIASRSNTPMASPVTPQPPIAQLFSNPPTHGTSPLMAQPQTPGGSLPAGARTPSHTPTPPPPIVSPSCQPARKPSLTSESSTIHHMAQTTHHTNISSFVPGDSSAQVSVAGSVVHHHHQQQQQQQHSGMVNINLPSSNITGIPPNINIQNLTGLPGMNIANLQGLQNMQVSLSVHGGGSIAVPISMISTKPQGILVTSTQGGGNVSVSASQCQPVQTTLVSMVTQHPTLSPATTSMTPITHVVTGVISQQSNVLPGTGMLSMPISLGPGLVPQGLKTAGQIRGSTHVPLQLQLPSGIQFLNLPQQRATLKPGTSLQGTMGVKATTMSQGPLTTTLLSAQGVGHTVCVKGATQGTINTTLTPQQIVFQPQFPAQLQNLQRQTPGQQQQQQQQQQLHFHQILKQQPAQTTLAFSGKPKTKNQTSLTPPKQ